ncbi:MAG: hypothetical protein J6V13_04165 [Paludibacteraceae bacterium]|nr:hypothetical protein [Paludibacteraceae bacterium]
MKTRYPIKEMLQYALGSSFTLSILMVSLYAPHIILENGVPWGLDDIDSWKDLGEWALIGFPIYFVVFLLIPILNRKVLKPIEPQAERPSIKATIDKMDKYLVRYTLAGSLILSLLFVILMPFVMMHITWGSPLWSTNLWACLAMLPIVMGTSLILCLIIYGIVILIRGARHY